MKRQGDPGSSRFYLSLEDPLLRIFASDRVAAIMERLKMPEGEAIEHRWVTRSIENAQRKVEARNFDIRKQLLEYDDVANDQRKVIYQQRNELLESDSVGDAIQAIREDVVAEVARRHVPADSIDEQWDLPGLERALAEEFGVQVDLQTPAKAEEAIDADGIGDIRRTACGHDIGRSARRGAVGHVDRDRVDRDRLLPQARSPA